MKKLFKIALFVILSLAFYKSALADTVIMRDGREIKGVVVEDYTDRIVISTIDGEHELMRDDIRQIIYDLEEQNLKALGDHYRDRSRYAQAYYYYKKALEINPGYQKARDGLDFAANYLQQRGRLDKLRHIEDMREGDRWRMGLPDEEPQEIREVLRSVLGLGFGDEQDRFLVTDIVAGSPASESSLAPGDRLASCWGRRVKYMHPEDVYEKLLHPGAVKVNLTFERETLPELGSDSTSAFELLGARFRHERLTGLKIDSINADGPAKKAGLREDDMVHYIQGISTRYMPEKEIEEIIRSRAGKTLSLKIERAETLWRAFSARD